MGDSVYPVPPVYPLPLARVLGLSRAGCLSLMAVVLSRLSNCHMPRRVEPTEAYTSTMFRDVAMIPFVFLLPRFELLFLTSTSVRSTVLKLFAPVSWLLAAVVLPVTPPLHVATLTALLLRGFTPVSTPARAPLSPLACPTPKW